MKFFSKIAKAGAEAIFMTPNMLNTSISPHINDNDILAIAEELMDLQNNGIMDKYMEAAKTCC